MAALRQRGEERTAAAGDVLFKVGDTRYPLIAIVEGEAAVLDPAGHEIIRHAAPGFLGEMNLLSGQTVYLTAVATQPMRYIAVEREALRELLFEDAAFGDLLLSTFMARREVLQRRELGPEIIGPWSAADTRRLVDYLRRARVPYVLRDTDTDGSAARGVDPGTLPLVRLPGGPDLSTPSNGELSRALIIGITL